MTLTELRRNTHVRLYIAAQQGRGVHLSAEEVYDLAMYDDAVCTRAAFVIDESGYVWDGTKFVKK